jgi:hypothetical protein
MMVVSRAEQMAEMMGWSLVGKRVDWMVVVWGDWMAERMAV